MGCESESESVGIVASDVELGVMTCDACDDQEGSLQLQAMGFDGSEAKKALEARDGETQVSRTWPSFWSLRCQVSSVFWFTS